MFPSIYPMESQAEKEPVDRIIGSGFEPESSDWDCCTDELST